MPSRTRRDSAREEATSTLSPNSPRDVEEWKVPHQIRRKGQSFLSCWLMCQKGTPIRFSTHVRSSWNLEIRLEVSQQHRQRAHFHTCDQKPPAFRDFSSKIGG